MGIPQYFKYVSLPFHPLHCYAKQALQLWTYAQEQCIGLLLALRSALGFWHWNSTALLRRPCITEIFIYFKEAMGILCIVSVRLKYLLAFFVLSLTKNFRLEYVAY